MDQVIEGVERWGKDKTSEGCRAASTLNFCGELAGRLTYSSDAHQALVYVYSCVWLCVDVQTSGRVSLTVMLDRRTILLVLTGDTTLYEAPKFGSHITAGRVQSPRGLVGQLA